MLKFFNMLVVPPEISVPEWRRPLFSNGKKPGFLKGIMAAKELLLNHGNIFYWTGVVFRPQRAGTIRAATVCVPRSESTYHDPAEHLHPLSGVCLPLYACFRKLRA